MYLSVRLFPVNNAKLHTAVWEKLVVENVREKKMHGKKISS